MVEILQSTPDVDPVATAVPRVDPEQVAVDKAWTSIDTTLPLEEVNPAAASLRDAEGINAFDHLRGKVDKNIEGKYAQDTLTARRNAVAPKIARELRYSKDLWFPSE